MRWGKFRLCFGILLWFSTSCGSSAGGQASGSSGSETPNGTTPNGLSTIIFEPNEGQTDQQVLFLSKTNGYNMYLTGSEVVFDVVVQEPSVDESLIIAPNAIVTRPGESAAVKFTFVGASDKITAEASNITEGVSNYLIGNDPAKWVTGVKNYEQVLVKNIYDKIDMKFYGAGNIVEHDFILHPGAFPQTIKMQVSGALGLSLGAAGDLEVLVDSATGTKLTVKRPTAYQDTKSNTFPAVFVIDNNIVSFSVQGYDPGKELIIDPVTLVYSTYLGGSLDDLTWGIDVDSSGNAYTVGYTKSTNFPTASAYQGTTGGGNFDAFVTKLNSTGSALTYSTYLGGSGDDLANAIKVDSSGNVYITGYTTSTNFPTASAFQASNAGGFDAFLTKLNSAGSALSYSTYYGGTNFDRGAQLAIDTSGNVYLIGTTLSTGLSTAGVTQTANAGAGDAFIATFNSSGSRTATTYLGGSGRDLGAGIAVDSSSNIYITGETRSSDFPLTSALDASLGGTQDAFIAKINSSLTTRSYSTYFGGSSSDGSAGIGLDTVSSGCQTAGSACTVITGTTSSTDLTTALANDTTYNGGKDVYITKLNSAGSAAVYSTYLGGNRDDEVLGFQSIFVDSNGEPWIVGKTNSTQTTFPIFQANIGTYPGSDSTVFVAKLASGTTAADLSFVTYHGGSTSGKSDLGIGIVVDSAASNCYVTGVADTTNFTTVGTPYDSTANGAKDGFLAKFTTPPVQFVASSTGSANNSNTVSITAAPTGTQSGDIMILAVLNSTKAAAVSTGPTNGTWTLIGTQDSSGSANNSDSTLRIYQKTAGTESGSYSITFDTGSQGVAAAILSFRNVNPTNLFDPTSASFSATASGTNHAAPSIDTLLKNTMLVTFYGISENASTWSTPTGMTASGVNLAGGNNGARNVRLGIFYELIPSSSGTTGTRTSTYGGTADSGATASLGLSER